MKKRKMIGIILALLLGIVIVLIPVDKKGNDDDPEIKDPVDIEVAYIDNNILSRNKQVVYRFRVNKIEMKRKPSQY